MTKRTIWVIAQQLKEQHFSLSDFPEIEDEKERRKAQEKQVIESLAPAYLVCTSRLEMEKKVKNLDRFGTANYTVNEIQINSFAIDLQAWLPPIQNTDPPGDPKPIDLKLVPNQAALDFLDSQQQTNAFGLTPQEELKLFNNEPDPF